MATNQDTNWTVIGNGSTPIEVLCRCVCGTVREVNKYNLRDGTTTGCGCTRGTHRRTGTRTYGIWVAMRQRVRKHPAYRDRGIRVCERWLNSFENFLEDMGQPPTNKHEIERKDNDGDYEPDNCKWATRKEQTRNTRQNRNYTYKGRTQCLEDWTSEFGFTRWVLAYRLNSGWDFEEAIRTPVGKNSRRKPDAPPVPDPAG